MFFASDNTGPAHPKVMDALLRANEGHSAAYGADTEMAAVTQSVRDIFEAPEAAVYLVATGTAANVILLATMADPWDTIFCAPMAHIHEDECNAPEFYSGAKLTLVPAENAKITPDSLRRAILAEGGRGVSGPQRGPVSLTQATEKGTVYSTQELQALTRISHDLGCKVHMDGARFTNALVSLDCSPAEMTWKAGIDAVSFGGTKNGLLGVEACIIFDPALAWEFELRRKRGGHLLSKHRFLAAQMRAYLTDDLWRDMARAANARTARLADGLRHHAQVDLLFEPEANVIFARFPLQLHTYLQEAGAVYSLWDDISQIDPAPQMVTARFVTDWSISDAEIDTFLNLLQQA